MNYAYNNYNNSVGRNYQMLNYSQPYYPQPVVQPQVAQQPTQLEFPLQYVGNGTQKEAEGYIIFPNQKGIFFDKANGMVYEKITYNDGQSFISAYKKVEDEKQVAEPMKEEKPLESGEFARKTDLKDFVTVEQYKELKEMFEGLKGQINGSKQASKTKAEKGEE